jgi:Domain of unknown function (DUF4190)
MQEWAFPAALCYPILGAATEQRFLGQGAAMSTSGFDDQPGAADKAGSSGQQADPGWAGPGGPGQYGQQSWAGPGGPGQYGQQGWPGPGSPGQYGQPGWPAGGGPAYPYGQPGTPWQVPRQTNSLAIAALCCAIGQVLAGPFAGIPAIVLGAMSLKQIRQTGREGRGLAMTGLVLGIIGTVLTVIFIIYFITFWHHVNSQFNNFNNFNN